MQDAAEKMQKKRLHENHERVLEEELERVQRQMDKDYDMKPLERPEEDLSKEEYWEGLSKKNQN